MNEPSIEPPPDEPPDEPFDELPCVNLNEPDEPPDEPLNEPSCVHLVFCFDPNPNIANFTFFPYTNTYFTANLDNLWPGNTYENLWTDPGNCIDITAPFKLNASPGAELDVGGTVSGIDDEQGTSSIDLEVDESPDNTLYDNPIINNAIDFTTNYCAVIGLGNNYSQASKPRHIRTTFTWNQVHLWHLVMIYTIYCLIPRPSVDNYTASSFVNLMLVTATSLSWPWLVTLSCLWSYFNLMLQ